MSLADIPASLAYKAAARPAEALARLEEWKATTDGFARADMVQAVASRQATYELEQQRTRLTGLREANARQRRQLGGLAGGAALLLGLLGVSGQGKRIKTGLPDEPHYVRGV